MKTYLLSILSNIQRFSESLDVQATLCNKSWWVFNDTGEKELYIFNTDGTLINSLNGRVANGTWRYVPANKTLLISTPGESFLLHPKFLDGIIFALQLDGTQECCFMIDENNADLFQPKSLNALNAYFQQKQQLAIQAENQRLHEEQERQRRAEIEMQEQQKKARDEQEIQRLLEANEEYQKIINRESNYEYW